MKNRAKKTQNFKLHLVKKTDERAAVSKKKRKKSKSKKMSLLRSECVLTIGQNERLSEETTMDISSEHKEYPDVIFPRIGQNPRTLNIVSMPTASCDREMQEKIEKFEAVINFGELINSSIDYEKVYNKAVKKLKQIFQCEYVNIYRVDDKKSELYYDYVTSRDGKKEIRFPINQDSFAGSCAHFGATLIIKDIKNDLRYYRTQEDLKRIPCQNMLLAPVVSRGAVLGVIQAINSRYEEFTNEDVYFIEAISNQLTVAFDNLKLFEKLNDQFYQVCEALGSAMLKKDLYTGGHTKRVAIFSELIGRELNLSFKEMIDLKLASILHDIGKIGIEDRILKKGNKLTDEEFEEMKRHPIVGNEILGHIESLKDVVDGVRYHHERVDGTGYPYGLKGDEIPLIAQIIAVADAFDAMISNRPYRMGVPLEDVYREIIDNAGTQFSTKVVAAFDKAFKKSKLFSGTYQDSKIDLNKKVA